MSPFHYSVRAFAGGVAVCWVVRAATALPAETRASIDNFTFEADIITVPVGPRWGGRTTMTSCIRSYREMAHFVRRRSTPRTSLASPSIKQERLNIFAV
jgi:hypothetical protein